MRANPPQPEARPAGRPRDPAVDQAITRAALELLMEHGFDGMSIEAVARRAGVGKPTIYRRWPSKHDLAVAVLEGISDFPEMPREGSARERLTAFMDALCAAAEAADAMQLSSSLLAEAYRDPVLGDAVRKQLLDNRRKKILAVVRDGIRTGELRSDTDPQTAADVLIAPLMLRRLVTGGGVNRRLGRQLVDVLFEGYGN